MRVNDRLASHPADALLNFVEVEGIVAQWPILKEGAAGYSLHFSLDISTERTLIRFPVVVFDGLAVRLKQGPHVLMPGNCVVLRGKLSGTLRRHGHRARWYPSVRAYEVEILEDGGFTGQLVKPPELPEPTREEFPEEVF